MSHIFDALQRSEAERAGAESSLAEPSTYSLATELLQAAERKRRGASAPTIAPGVALPEDADPLEQFPACRFRYCPTAG